jgi:amidophosphoribosyltransferase
MGVLPKATTADSQLMLELFASRQVDQSERGAFGQISRVRAGVEEICRHCDGSFACILMIPGFGLVAFRDPHGIKPLVVGEKKSAKGGKDVMVASETRALHKLGFSSVRDIRPGMVPLRPEVVLC